MLLTVPVAVYVLSTSLALYITDLLGVNDVSLDVYEGSRSNLLYKSW